MQIRLQLHCSVLIYVHICTHIYLISSSSYAVKEIILEHFHHSFVILKDKKMSWKGKAWAVAGTVAAMGELKDKRLCRLECSSLSSLCHPHNVEDNLEPLSTQKERSSNEYVETQRKGKKQNLKQTEESLRIIMYLSCWGPN